MKKKEKEKMAEDEVDMYDATCDCCDLRLSIDVDIMCWEKRGEEKTLCNLCYFDDTQDWWKTDTNSDNEDEIEEYRLLLKKEKKKKKKRKRLVIID